MGDGLIVRRGGGTGSPEGLNAWIKRNRQANQQATINVAVTGKTVSTYQTVDYFTFTSSNPLIELSSLTYDTFFKNLKIVTYYSDNSSTVTWTFTDDGTYQWTKGSTTTTGAYTWDPSTGKLTINGTSIRLGTTNNGLKSVSNNKVDIPWTDLCYVVDDEPTAFPDGDYGSDGYWYDLIASISEESVASLSDAVVASVQEDYREQVESEVSQS